MVKIEMSQMCHDAQHAGRVSESVILRVDVGPHGECCIGVTEPGSDHRDRDALQMHERSAGMPCVVEPDPADTGSAHE